MLNFLNVIMIFIKRFAKEEVLKLIASEAAESLPKSKKGMIDAQYRQDGSIEVYFIEYGEAEQLSS